MEKRSVEFFVVLIVALLFMAASASAQSVLLTGDAQINSAATTTNYGASQALSVNSTNSVLLQFDLADILPTGITAAQVSKARLILFPDSVATAGSFNVYGITGTWAEGTVTYANQPAVSTSSSGSGAAKATFGPIYVQVTGLVQSWITTPSSNHGIEVKATGTTNFTIDSKENTATSHQAVLQIDLTGPAGATGATGPAGPAGAAGAKGATGATGPPGTLVLPYSASSNGSFVFSLTNTGTTVGGGVFAQGAPGSGQSTGGVGVEGGGGQGGDGNFTTGGTGVLGLGGRIGAGQGAQGGTGVEGRGADTLFVDAGTYGGAGGVFQGGQAPGGSGYGLFAFGGDGLNGGAGGEGLVAYPGANATVAAEFYGEVDVHGNLSKAGGSFKIDHPLDPENKYLYHSFVESPDMMNIYNGTVVTDSGGNALVTMPDYFEALNRDFRYQLTVIGQFAQAIIASEISGGSFRIKTDRPGVKVSWQVTGVRQDAWANAHRIPVEQDKAASEKGKFLHPELFGRGDDAGIMQKGPRRLQQPQ